jgi:hypothetical protein
VAVATRLTWAIRLTEMFATCPNCGFAATVDAKTMDEGVRLANEGKLTVWCLKCDFHGLSANPRASEVRTRQLIFHQRPV